MPAPTPLPEPNMALLIESIRHEVEYVEEHGHHHKDGDHHIFEEAMEAVYGPDIWEWYNDIVDRSEA
jgi:hypothetical protein